MPMMTSMGNPCPGTHTPVATVQWAAGGRQRHRIGERGEAAVQRVASCPTNDCHLASRISPSHPSRRVGSPTHLPRCTRQVSTATVVTAGAPVGVLPRSHASRASERRAMMCVPIPVAGHPLASPQHDVAPHPHIAPGGSRSSKHLIPSSPRVVVVVVAGTPMLVQLVAQRTPLRAPRGSTQEKEKAENLDEKSMH